MSRRKVRFLYRCSVKASPKDPPCGRALQKPPCEKGGAWTLGTWQCPKHGKVAADRIPATQGEYAEDAVS